MGDWREWVGRKLMTSIDDVEAHERLPLMRVAGWLLPRAHGVHDRIAAIRGLIRSFASPKLAEAFEQRFDDATRVPTIADLEIAARFLRKVGHAIEARLSMVGLALEHITRAIEDARHAERQVEAAVEGIK